MRDLILLSLLLSSCALGQLLPPKFENRDDFSQTCDGRNESRSLQHVTSERTGLVVVLSTDVMPKLPWCFPAGSTWMQEFWVQEYKMFIEENPEMSHLPMAALGSLSRSFWCEINSKDVHHR